MLFLSTFFPGCLCFVRRMLQECLQPSSVYRGVRDTDGVYIENGLGSLDSLVCGQVLYKENIPSMVIRHTTRAQFDGWPLRALTSEYKTNSRAWTDILANKRRHTALPPPLPCPPCEIWPRQRPAYCPTFAPAPSILVLPRPMVVRSSYWADHRGR